MDPQRLSPREFMRARRPERFSDSTAEDEPVLNRSMLEYHLDSLTSRSQEADFERFALRLAQCEVCPNLLPHTGPTGGGDSKVDTETYPVADQLSLVWHTGIGREAATERWAFAFSTKKKWQDKIRSDVAKIANTKRGYSTAFFITSQFVSDRVRGRVEDKLREEHNLDVRILDRSWILDHVFGGGHEGLAVEDLRLTSSVRKRVQKGPLDVQRERELAEIEQRVKSAGQQGRFSIQSVEDCIDSAILARGLDRPRTEVEGLFLRAERVAEKHGTSHQRLSSVYHAAWTAYWWYEDYKQFAELYVKVEGRTAHSANVYDLELLSNVWRLLHSLVGKGDLSAEDVGLELRTQTLLGSLERLSKEKDRPSTALQAKTLLLEMQLQLSPTDCAGSVFHELQGVIRECQGLVGYPLDYTPAIP